MKVTTSKSATAPATYTQRGMVAVAEPSTAALSPVRRGSCSGLQGAASLAASAACAIGRVWTSPHAVPSDITSPVASAAAAKGRMTSQVLTSIAR